ncbi:hypothetical protein JGY85_25450 (plasmid) [Shigella sonnei]|nr:hypothetical protein [Shigella sonnei]
MAEIPQNFFVREPGSTLTQVSELEQWTVPMRLMGFASSKKRRKQRFALEQNIYSRYRIHRLSATSHA